MPFEATLMGQILGRRTNLGFFPVVTAALAVGQSEVIGVFLTEPFRPLKLAFSQAQSSRFRVLFEDIESNELLPGMEGSPRDGQRINSTFQARGTTLFFTITRRN